MKCYGVRSQLVLLFPGPMRGGRRRPARGGPGDTPQQHAASIGTREEAGKHLGAIRHAVRSLLGHVKEFEAFAEERIGQLENALSKNISRLSVTRELGFFGGGSSGSGMHVTIDAPTLEQVKSRRALCDPTRRALGRFANLTSLNEAESLPSALADLRAQFPPELQQSLTGYDELVRTAKAVHAVHLATASIRIPGIMVAILAWLCVLGLVAPLAFLSAHGSFSKRFLLVGFSIGICAIPVYIGVELFRIYRLRRVVLQESALSDPLLSWLRGVQGTSA